MALASSWLRRLETSAWATSTAIVDRSIERTVALRSESWRASTVRCAIRSARVRVDEGSLMPALTIVMVTVGRPVHGLLPRASLGLPARAPRRRPDSRGGHRSTISCRGGRPRRRFERRTSCGPSQRGDRSCPGCGGACGRPGAARVSSTSRPTEPGCRRSDLPLRRPRRPRRPNELTGRVDTTRGAEKPRC
jgi:hypothetical protein